mmetsp:Transcript_32987/g.82333  ORF Transcript_32987/g.82333 Transcript_32987/m.82333 type:complete len:304 (-) Transcript_32987:894-1805(-)
MRTAAPSSHPAPWVVTCGVACRIHLIKLLLERGEEGRVVAVNRRSTHHGEKQPALARYMVRISIRDKVSRERHGHLSRLQRKDEVDGDGTLLASERGIVKRELHIVTGFGRELDVRAGTLRPRFALDKLRLQLLERDIRAVLFNILLKHLGWELCAIPQGVAWSLSIIRGLRYSIVRRDLHLVLHRIESASCVARAPRLNHPRIDILLDIHPQDFRQAKFHMGDEHCLEVVLPRALIEGQRILAARVWRHVVVRKLAVVVVDAHPLDLLREKPAVEIQHSENDGRQRPNRRSDLNPTNIALKI